MIRWVLDHAEGPIMVKRKIMNGDDMRRNMRCFSEGGRTHPKCAFEDAVPMPPADTVVRCHGWLTIPRDSLPPDFHHAREMGDPVYYEETSHYFALVYDYVQRSPRDREFYVMQENLDFFYYAGFTYWDRNPNNWRGERLVDFGDLASPFRFRPDWHGPPTHSTSLNFFGRLRQVQGYDTGAGRKKAGEGTKEKGDDEEAKDRGAEEKTRIVGRVTSDEVEDNDHNARDSNSLVNGISTHGEGVGDVSSSAPRRRIS